MNSEQRPLYPGPGPSARGRPKPAKPKQGYQACTKQPNRRPGTVDPHARQPGYQSSATGPAVYVVDDADLIAGWALCCCRCLSAMMNDDPPETTCVSPDP